MTNTVTDASTRARNYKCVEKQRKHVLVTMWSDQPGGGAGWGEDSETFHQIHHPRQEAEGGGGG